MNACISFPRSENLALGIPGSTVLGVAVSICNVDGVPQQQNHSSQAPQFKALCTPAGATDASKLAASTWAAAGRSTCGATNSRLVYPQNTSRNLVLTSLIKGQTPENRKGKPPLSRRRGCSRLRLRSTTTGSA